MTKALVIDDSAFSRLKICQSLKKINLETIEAENGKKGLEVLKSQDGIEIVFCDLLMPEMTGFEFLEECKKNNIDKPIIIITSDIQETTKTKCFELGAFDFLNKPNFKDAELLKTMIEKALK